ncbi:hypothetical protein AIGOOFII_3463 [Methylobacterium marchantiae]|nr:hypothetical protein AIGOOFII_3463 [Methylobacterium marchantiae]
MGFDIFVPDHGAPYRRYWANFCGTLVCVGTAPCQPGDLA